MASTNNTTTSVAGNVSGKWTFVSVFTLASMISVFITNVPVTLQILCRPRLRTPFNIYLINLLLANILQVFLQNPLAILESIYSRWWMGRTACNLYIYAYYVLAGVIMLSHLLIAINRVWAVTFPVHYRHHHSKSVAISICVASWIWNHILLLPGIISDALFYRRPIEKVGCELNKAAQPVWSMTVHWVVYVAPTLLILLSFPYVTIKRARRRRGVVGVRVAAQGTDQGKYDKTAKLELSSPEANNEIMDIVDESGFAKKRSQGMLICFALFACQAAIDPLLFAFAIKDLRLSFTNQTCSVKQTA
ncbi:muscarinic acetylcholine receptor M3-like [Paramacrobiotus metropolitanus]|uniref:muscarinic acetylcholine receptor M3-like n=1 Tax=Paramacrobiotus metropolitanus TaxID=2943436 RepID=UPI00244638E6|nr:muscarinic acetylcholine receptor M3-like [Paramacrobiotus metropolitanus]